MTPDEISINVSEITEEERNYQYLLVDRCRRTNSLLADDILIEFNRLNSQLLACRQLSEERRAMLEKGQWIIIDPNSGIWFCYECGKRVSTDLLKQYQGNRADLHFPDCRLAALVKKGE